ncbi:hypothetical protein BTA51_05235 [Hahella sp. CCB-MM4]|uniref:Lcl domain-containing protein n=1 Tax=Hahella sp. (strain CCB-MM4) TaxID=1926491 RepID=UPI000BD6A968|nr:DUF1566 domain-containing protein [Hahella sp. CCB-MM4]OZG74413.1 hypothetical protein BTA51_05235 [Hahella sp. CCB-MM4]
MIKFAALLFMLIPVSGLASETMCGVDKAMDCRRSEAANSDRGVAAIHYSPTLDGRILYRHHDNLVEFDVERGTTHTVPIPGAEQVAISYSGTEYAAIYSHNNGSVQYDEISLVSFREGGVSRFSTILGQALSAPLISPNGQFVALLLRYSSSNFGKQGESIGLYSKDGNFINSYSATDGEIGDFTWHPNGRLLVSVDNKIIFVAVGDPARQHVITNLSHKPHNLAISRDGKQLAFSMYDEESRNNHIFVMGVDGKNLRRITAFNGSQVYPTWSPDGQYIAFFDEYSSFENGNNVCQAIYVVKVDQYGIDVSKRNNREVSTFQQKTLTNNVVDTCVNPTRIDWIPNLPESRGVAASISGSENGTPVLAGHSQIGPIKYDNEGCLSLEKEGLSWMIANAQSPQGEFTWFIPGSQANPGHQGGPNLCRGIEACNISDYLSLVNRTKLCGYDDWRLPSRTDFRSLEGYVSEGMLRSHFTDIQNHTYWTNETMEESEDMAWAALLSNDQLEIVSGYKNGPARVILVRGGCPRGTTCILN